MEPHQMELMPYTGHPHHHRKGYSQHILNPAHRADEMIVGSKKIGHHLQGSNGSSFFQVTVVRVSKKYVNSEVSTNKDTIIYMIAFIIYCTSPEPENITIGLWKTDTYCLVR